MSPMTRVKTPTTHADQAARKELEAKILGALADAKSLNLGLLAYLLEMSLQELIEADARLASISRPPEA